MAFDVEVQLRLQLAEIFRRVQGATEDGLEEALLLDVLPEAVQLSPHHTLTTTPEDAEGAGRAVGPWTRFSA